MNSVSRTNTSGTDNDFDRPSGTELSASIPRHFVSGYDQPVPPGQKPFAHPRASHSVSAYGFNPGNRPPGRRALKGRQIECTNKAEVVSNCSTSESCALILTPQ